MGNTILEQSYQSQFDPRIISSDAGPNELWSSNICVIFKIYSTKRKITL